MTNKKLYFRLRVGAALTLAMLCANQSASLASRDKISSGDKTLKLVTEYKKNILEDISPDGRLLLFYQTSAPTRSYTIELDGSRGKANQPPVTDDALRVVERESGRELGRIRVEFFPLEQQFIPGAQRVFYSEPKSRAESARLYKIWDIASGRALVCLDAPEGGFSSVTFLDQQHALGTISKQVEQYTGGMLGALALTNCKRQVIGPVDPTDPRVRTGGRISLSPDKNLLAYSLYVGSQAIVWDIKKQQVERRLDISPLFIGEEVVYTPDGRLLLITARTRPFAGDDSKTFLLFYDTRTYQQVRRLEVPGASAIAISPDSRLLALGYTVEKKKAFSTTEQAKVAIYDLVTGEEVALASHPPVKQQRSDPFIAKVTRLAFTPDGEYLLSSTYDTRLWQLGR